MDTKNIIQTDFFDNKFQEENKERFDAVFSRGFIEHYDEEINEYYNENRPEGGWHWEQ